MQNGAYSFSVRAILPSVSTPNWTAMMAGVGPEGTGAIDNSWVNGELTFPYVCTTGKFRFPTIFRIIREQIPKAVIGSIHNWDDFPNMYEKELLDVDENYDDDADVASRSAECIKEKKPNFMFCYFTDPDHTMHGKGHLSPSYLDIIETLDGYVQTIVNAINDAGIADKTVIMLMSDHGGLFYAHGGNSHEELATPFIFSGKGIKKNYLIRQQMYRYDLAADIAFALGLTPPQQWVGRPTKPAYVGFDEPANLYHGTSVIPSPVFITKEINENFTYGGLWIDAPAVVDIQNRPDTEAGIYYTLDGSVPTKESACFTEPFRLEKSTVVRAKNFSPDGVGVPVSAQYRIADTKSGNGVNYAVYHCPNSQTMPVSFKGMKPVATGICYEFGFYTPENISDSGLLTAIGRYKDHIAVCFDSYIQIDTEGSYQFSLWSTGGSKLYIGDELIVNNRSNGHTGNTGDIELKKGVYPICVEIFHNDSAVGTILITSYEYGSAGKRIIPADKLFRTKK
jgi:hypothetical protein